jgi:hypothetical protein
VAGGEPHLMDLDGKLNLPVPKAKEYWNESWQAAQKRKKSYEEVHQSFEHWLQPSMLPEELRQCTTHVNYKGQLVFAIEHSPVGTCELKHIFKMGGEKEIRIFAHFRTAKSSKLITDDLTVREIFESWVEVIQKAFGRHKDRSQSRKNFKKWINQDLQFIDILDTGAQPVEVRPSTGRALCEICGKNIPKGHPIIGLQRKKHNSYRHYHLPCLDKVIRLVKNWIIHDNAWKEVARELDLS